MSDETTVIRIACMDRRSEIVFRSTLRGNVKIGFLVEGRKWLVEREIEKADWELLLRWISQSFERRRNRPSGKE